jgi:UDP:flavonoid glycosyltransferase YjiC (YdhE family)
MKGKKRAAPAAEQPDKVSLSSHHCRHLQKRKKSSEAELPTTSSRTTPAETSRRSTSYKTDMLEKVLKANASLEVDLAPRRRVTHRMVTEMPRSAALDTAEILENVLSFLTPISLFSLHSVSRQWRDLVRSSPFLKEKMFLRVSTRTPDIWRLINPKPYPTIDWDWDMPPALPDLAGQGFRNASVTEVESRAWSTSPGETQHLYTPVSLNPFLFTADHFDCKWIEGT